MKDIYNQSVEKHKKFKGKLSIKSKFPLKNKKDLSLAYTPGVAAVCREIVKDKKASYSLTGKGNNAAIITDGSAVLGLGNIGPEAAIPVMEGKAIIFKEFAGVDAYPVCLATQDVNEIIKAVKMISPYFGAINLEDISAPRCFEIEKALIEELDIPVFHDDQHGTAIVVLAALYNALKVVGKKFNQIKIIINGAGAAGLATARMILSEFPRDLIIIDRAGAIFEGRKENMNFEKEAMAKLTNREKAEGGLAEVLKGADVFIGLSAADVLSLEMIESMNEEPIVFAMANPDPEINSELAKKTKIKVFGTGRSDLPNQINNALAFPGIFRGALDTGVKKITLEMKMAAAKAIAESVPEEKLSHNFIMPDILDKKVHGRVAEAIKEIKS